jgi:hypothetical protein
VVGAASVVACAEMKSCKVRIPEDLKAVNYLEENGVLLMQDALIRKLKQL